MDDFIRELKRIMDEHYCFVEDEHATWERAIRQLPIADDVKSKVFYYYCIQKAFRAMQDSHLQIFYHKLLYPNLRRFYVWIDKECFLYIPNQNSGKPAFHSIISIDGKSLSDMRHVFQKMYPDMSEGMISEYLTEDLLMDAYEVETGCQVVKHPIYQLSTEVRHLQEKIHLLAPVPNKIIKVNDDVAYLCLPSFEIGDLFINQELAKLESDYLLIDVRNNRGGSIRKARETLSKFLPRSYFELRDYDILSRFGKESIRIKGLGFLPQSIKVGLLVNQFTRSSAEYIFSWYLKTIINAKVYGCTTTGAPGQARLFSVGNDVELSVTTKKYYLPSGERVVQGIVPDYHITNSINDILNGFDRQLFESLELIRQ